MIIITKINAIIYMTFTPVLLNSRSATPQIKKAVAKILEAIPVDARHFGS